MTSFLRNARYGQAWNDVPRLYLVVECHKSPMRMRRCNEEVTDSQQPKHWVPAAAKTETLQIKRRHWAEVSY